MDVPEEPTVAAVPSPRVVPPADRPQRQAPSRKRQTKDRNESRRLCYIVGVVGCCLVILLIIGLVLGLVVFDNRGNDRDNAGTTAEAGQTDEDAKTPGVSNPSSGGLASSPTFSDPTRSPVQRQTGAPTILPTIKEASTPNATPRPTLRPTVTSVSAPIPTPTSVLQPSPSQIIILPYADTFIYRDGFSTSQAFGTEDTFLVQNGPGFVRDDVADAVGLLAFDVAAGLSAAGQSATAIQQITLRLSHEPAVWDRGAATLTIRRLPSTQMAIETLHAGLFDPADDAFLRGLRGACHDELRFLRGQADDDGRIAGKSILGNHEVAGGRAFANAPRRVVM